MRQPSPGVFRLAIALASVSLVAILASGAVRAADPAVAVAPPAAAKLPAAKSKYREIAPGVEITIPANRQEADTYATHDLVEIVRGIPNLEWSPKYTPNTRTLKDKATARVFHRSVWYLDFTFKPVRMIWVDVPQESGKMQRKLIWYMVYHVKNVGQHLKPVKKPQVKKEEGKEDSTYVIEQYDEEVTFSPHVVLEAPEFNEAYLDRVIPVAVQAIQEKEDPRRKLLNSVEMGESPIPVSTATEDKSVWGVFTWEDVDPRIDFFSVYIQGLTNAYRWVDPPGGYKPGDPPGHGRILTHATLMLNFWRPGDSLLEDKRSIHYGFPDNKRIDKFRIPKVDYTWLFR